MRDVHTCYITRTVIATTMAAAMDATEKVRMLIVSICAACQAITMPGRTVRTTGGRAITRALQAATATTATAQGAGLGHLLGEVRGIAIGIIIKIETEIEVETGSKIAIGIVPDCLTGAEAD